MALHAGAWEDQLMNTNTLIPKKIDDAPGNYYVSVVDAGRVGLLAGPFPNDHAGALAMVKKTKKKTKQTDP